MAKRQQNPRKTPTGEWLYITFSVKPKEREAYRELADVDSKGRSNSLSWWIRDVLNREVARRKGISDANSNGENQSVGVAPVSPDRA